MHDDVMLVLGDGPRGALLVTPPTALTTTPAALVMRPPSPGWRGKRTFDFAVAAVLLLLVLPVFLVLALIVKLTSRGPVFFRQRRVGRNGEDFPMLKFRTMRTGAEERLRTDGQLHELFLAGGHKIPSHLDPRVTPVGRVLRRLSLDELPQLLNVLFGHMSMVGPRPVERSQFLRDYASHESAYLPVRPGLTGLWQVSGRSTVHFPERAEMDRQYVQNCRAWTDAKIIFRTPLVVFTGQGAD
jgi:exopolysaccharide production protein ExoY